MPDRFKYAKVRQKIINALRTDLMGPQSADEILDEKPKERIHHRYACFSGSR